MTGDRKAHGRARTLGQWSTVIAEVDESRNRLGDTEST